MATKKEAIVTFRTTPEFVQRLDAMALIRNMTRSQLVDRLVRQAMEVDDG